MLTSQLVDAATACAPSEAITELGRNRMLTQLGRLLIASDGTIGADGAVRLGLALSHRDGVETELITVFDPKTPIDHSTAPAQDAEYEELWRKGKLWDSMTYQRHRVAPQAEKWPVLLETGDPAREITRIARERRHQLIVLGLGAHGALERYLRREMALRVLRESDLPVLAVAPSCKDIPRTVLVALDFSVSSLQAAQAALSILGDDGTLYLAHVMPRVVGTTTLGEPPAWEVPYNAGVRALFEALESRLGVPEGVRVQRVILDGNPAHELLTFAQAHDVNLIAAGCHGYSKFQRALLGSVSTKLVRGAQCSLIVVPGKRRTPFAA